jgi:hypothetical protein
MDSLASAAARALVAGDVLGALKLVALREDPPALALRGIAMARLGEYARARELLRRAARGFGAHEVRARARCVVAEAEVALAMRDLRGSPRALAAAAATLEARDDRANALQARLIAVRRLLLLGRLEEAASCLGRPDARGLPPSLRAVAELLEAELALRSLRTTPAREALARARARPSSRACPRCTPRSTRTHAALDRPRRPPRPGGARAAAAPRGGRGAALPRAPWWSTPAVAACTPGGTRVPLARRPVLFALARALAEAWPGDVDRAELDRARLPHPPPRRPRTARACASRSAACARSPRRWPASRASGARLRAEAARRARRRRAAAAHRRRSGVAAGAARRRRGLVHLGARAGARGSQRTVQRALVELEAAGRVRSIGRARAQRWLSPPLAGFTTILLLPAALPLG